ncbi:MAG: hypothetical protein P4L50_30420 [Anaerolineaceae bacterium]|nr:hypothetical protein [Anaerolineaceae bacterium]
MQLDIPPTASSTDLTQDQQQAQWDAMASSRYQGGPMKAYGFSSLSEAANLLSPGATGEDYLQGIGSIAAVNGMTTSKFSAGSGLIIPSPNQSGDYTGLGLAIINQDNAAAAQQLTNSQAQGQWLNSQARADLLQQQGIQNALQIISGAAPNIFGAPVSQNPILQYISQSGSDIPQVSALSDSAVPAAPNKITWSANPPNGGDPVGGDVLYAYNSNGNYLGSKPQGLQNDISLLPAFTGGISGMAESMVGNLVEDAFKPELGDSGANLVSNSVTTILEGKIPYPTVVLPKFIIDRIKNSATSNQPD